eukprot:3994260-Pleurochrysis_carterae.AAC.1
MEEIVLVSARKNPPPISSSVRHATLSETVELSLDSLFAESRCTLVNAALSVCASGSSEIATSPSTSSAAYESLSSTWSARSTGYARAEHMEEKHMKDTRLGLAVFLFESSAAPSSPFCKSDRPHASKRSRANRLPRLKSPLPSERLARGYDDRRGYRGQFICACKAYLSHLRARLHLNEHGLGEQVAEHAGELGALVPGGIERARGDARLPHLLALELERDERVREAGAVGGHQTLRAKKVHLELAARVQPLRRKHGRMRGGRLPRARKESEAGGEREDGRVSDGEREDGR